jgi:hypothetical protein
MAVKSRNNKKNNKKTNIKNNKQALNKKMTNHVDVVPLVFLDLTQANIEEGEENLQHERLFTSTHDLAELMLYSFVDNTPHVADLLWSKQLLDQEDFLTLTDEQDWSEIPFIDFSTHEPLLC